jgi:hypothetical protein
MNHAVGLEIAQCSNCLWPALIKGAALLSMSAEPKQDQPSEQQWQRALNR